MIVFEGPDGAGKTTLIDSIAREFQLQVMPRVVSKDTRAIVNLVKWVEEDNNRPPYEPVIYDRHRLISEGIYGPILRGAMEEGFNNPWWLQVQLGRFFARRPLVIYCLPSINQVRLNVKRGTDNKVVSKSIDKIYGAYVFRASLDRAYRPFDTFIYDYHDHVPRDIAGMVQARLALEGSL